MPRRREDAEATQETTEETFAIDEETQEIVTTGETPVNAAKGGTLENVIGEETAENEEGLGRGVTLERDAAIDEVLQLTVGIAVVSEEEVIAAKTSEKGGNRLSSSLERSTVAKL